MIKGSTKVGEIFVISHQTDGKPEVQSQFLGKAITGLGGGCQKMFVIEEGDGYQGILNPLHPFDQENEQFYSAGEEDNKSNIIVTNSQVGGLKQFQSSPFEQQQNFYQIQKPPLTNVDQRIEERESLRHSTHRSQRSERLAPHGVGAGGGMQHTATDRFGNTDYNSEHVERPAFQGQNYRGDSHQDHRNNTQQNFHQEDGLYMEVQHQMEQQPDGFNDDEPSKMFTFEEQNQQVPEDRQSQRSSGQNQQLGKQQFQGAPSRTQQQQSQIEGSTNMGHLMMVASGRNHSIHLTRDGEVFSYGSGTYSAAGHGGSKGQAQPTLLKPLRDKRIIQIACGEFHSLVLTDKADVYAWGRGFEGQLGLSKSIQIASTPQYIKSFYGKPVTYIAAGALFSLAITKDGSIWGWGEAKCGQLGLGKQRSVLLPTKIPFEEEDGKNFIQCSAGYGHSAALTDQGNIFTWGFNNYGQCGQGHKETLWAARRVNFDYNCQLINPMQKICCSYYATYAIDQYGGVFSCGKFPIGHKEQENTSYLRRLNVNTEDRIFTDVFTNENSAILYAPIRVFSISPKCGPASGNSTIKIVGTGFVNSEKLRVRYSYGDLSQELSCNYDPMNKCIVAKTPKFEEFEGEKHPSLKFPCDCIISVTMDGIHYSECEEVFKIYSNDIYLTSINPKCGSVQGGTTLTLLINIDEVTASNLYFLTIGFQPKKNSLSSQYQSKKSIDNRASQAHTKSYQSLNESNKSSVAGSRAGLHKEDNHINQIQQQQYQSTDNQDDEENTTTSPGWTCTSAHYENGTITCTVPALTTYDQESLQFNVDVALNGQQFTGKPLQFRYYDINIQKIDPALGPSEGGTVINIIGQGLYDSNSKRVKFETHGYERIVTAQWDRKLKCLQCIVPPLTWLFGGVEVPQDELERIKLSPIKVLLTFNNQEWIQAKEFKYLDCKIERIAYAHTYGNDIADLTERDKFWRSEEPLEKYPDEMSPEEIKKREDEKAKKAQEETEESQTVAKRKGVKIFLYGQNFVKSQYLKIRFSHANTGVSKEVNAIFKNSKKVGCDIPDMGGDVPVGQQHLIVEISLNGQQFTSNGVQFLFNSVDPNLTDEELKKMDELEEKNQKKPPNKKSMISLNSNTISTANPQASQYASNPAHPHILHQFQNPYTPKSNSQFQQSQPTNIPHASKLANDPRSAVTSMNYHHFPQPQMDSHTQNNPNSVQSQYYTYLNSFQNEPQDQMQKSNVQGGAQKKSLKQQMDQIKQLGLSAGNINSKEIQRNTKPNHKNSTQTIVSMKKSSINNNEKLSSYLVEPGRQAITNIGYSTQQIVPLSYSSQQLQNINHLVGISDQIRISAFNTYSSPQHNSANKKQKLSQSNRKSLSKENQSQGSSRGASKIYHYHGTVGVPNKPNKSKVVKSNLRNKKHQFQDQHHQVNYQRENFEISPSQLALLQHHKESISSRYDQQNQQTEEMIRSKINKIQQSHQVLPSNIKSQRTLGGGKASIRNNIQLKLNSLNPSHQSNNFDSFDNINHMFHSNYALSTKNPTNSSQRNLFSSTAQNHFKSPESFQNRNGTTQISDDANNQDSSLHFSKLSHNNKIQQKIQKIIQANQLQNSSSQGNLRKNSNAQMSANNSNMNKIFRPQSLKQLMPTIDEQIMKLTGEQHQSSQQLYQTLTDNQKQNKKIIPIHPSNIKNQGGRSSARNIEGGQFNHKESIEGIKVAENQTKQQSINSLQDILIRTTQVLQQYKDREALLNDKCQKQEEEILYLKKQLMAYESNLN